MGEGFAIHSSKQFLSTDRRYKKALCLQKSPSVSLPSFPLPSKVTHTRSISIPLVEQSDILTRLFSFSSLCPLSAFSVLTPCHKMVSKIVGLTLLAALASTVSAYTYYAHLVLPDPTALNSVVKVHIVDDQVPGNNEAVFMEYRFPGYPDFDQYSSFKKYGYTQIEASIIFRDSEVELNRLTEPNMFTMFSCQRIDRFTQPGPCNSTLTWKVYSCENKNFYDKKGIPAPPPTTSTPVVPLVPCPTTTTNPPPQTTTTNPPKPTTTPPKPTTTPPKPTPTCLAGYNGKGNGKGPDGACCSKSGDCKDTCVQGICRDRCLTGYEGKGNGKGPNGACCSKSGDCKDTCVKGICGVHP